MSTELSKEDRERIEKVALERWPETLLDIHDRNMLPRLEWTFGAIAERVRVLEELEAKDKEIAELKAENEKLRKEIKSWRPPSSGI